MSIGHWFGIPVWIHWSFFLLLGLVAVWIGWGEGWRAGGVWLITIGLLFLSVLLHELGHSLTSVGLGYGVRDILLLPIGGVSRMEDSPEDALDELMITAAGPMVNFVLAIVLAMPIMLGWAGMHPPDPTQPWFVSNLLWLNIMLGIFNLLPAFPMDGGRLLRSLLSLAVGRGTATRVASLVGQVMAGLMGIAGLLIGNLWLVLIGIFVFMAGRGEARVVLMEERLRGLRVGDLAVRRPAVLSEESSLQQAADLARTSFQKDFPVADPSGRLVGLLGRGSLRAGLASRDGAGRVGDWMSDAPRVALDEELNDAWHRMMKGGHSAAVAIDDEDRVAGLLTLEQIRMALEQGDVGSGEPTDI